MNNVKKELFTATVFSFLTITASISSAWAGPIVTKKECDTIKESCMRAAPDLRKVVNRLTDGKDCKALPRRNKKDPGTTDVAFYGPSGSYNPNVTLESLRGVSGGECLLSARILSANCKFDCKKVYNSGIDSKEQLYELTGGGTLKIAATPGRKKVTTSSGAGSTSGGTASGGVTSGGK